MSDLGTDAKMWGKGFGLSRLLWLISALGVVGFLQFFTCQLGFYVGVSFHLC